MVDLSAEECYNHLGDKMRILAIGEIIFDIFGDEAEMGGAPLNFCAHAAALGAETALISAVGRDDLSEEAFRRIRAYGVNTGFIENNDYPTGQCIVTLKNGSPSYDVVTPAAYDFVEADIEKIKAYSADVFAFGTLIQRNEKSRKAVEKILDNCSFTHVFCDVNLRQNCYEKDTCLRCLENATILKVSDEEEPLLNGFGLYESSENPTEILKNICEKYRNIKLIIYTKGERGSVVYSSEKDEYYAFEAEKADVISTVGAGDSYSAAFLCEYLKNGDVTAAGKAGSALSAKVVSHREAVPEI